MDFKFLSVLDIVDGIKTKKFSCVELTKYYLSQIEKYKDKNAVLEVFDDALERAYAVDALVESGADLPELVGVPILIKDNIFYKGKISSSASKMLEHYVAQYSSTVVKRLLKAGVVILGRTNMDEFAMGGSCENSAFGPCKNAHNDAKVSGGSSGGSAVAVALDMCAFALGSDTGGSIRQPASYNGIVGIKPTYARVSRYGLVPFAGSLDTCGVFTRDAKDSAYIMSLIAGRDEKDSSSSDMPVDDYLACISGSIKGKKIAIVKEVQELVAQSEYKDVFKKVIAFCQEHGAIMSEVSIPEYKSVLPVYYTIAPAEATSNMNKFDGVRFGERADGEAAEEINVNSRSKYLGREVKRRIMLGNFVLSSKFYNAYYQKAKDVAALIKGKFVEVLEKNDLIFMPTTFGEAFDIGAKTSDPVSMYIEDMFTVTANIIGVPAMSIPISKGRLGLPLGLQILAKHFNEKEIYNMADYLMEKGGEF